jgi:arabinan endo-1,5-alpha-L-arabinosidase
LLVWSLSVVGVAVSSPEPVQAAGSAPVQIPPTYANPTGVAGTAKSPFIMRSGTTYYAYVSGFDFLFTQYGARVFQSTDLVNWTSMGNALPLATAGNWADRTSGSKFSSPSVREIGTNPAAQRYVMYFTGIQTSTGNKCIGVATSSLPTGPFTGAANPLICPSGGAQDPSAMVLPDSAGIQEVIYRKNGASAGIYNQVLTANGLSIGSPVTPFLLYTAQANWWQEGVADRPAVVLDPLGNPYLVFSGGTPNTGGRAMGWSPCSHFGAIASCQNQTSLGSWISGTTQVNAPSGAQPFTDTAGHQWLVYDGLAAGSCSGTTTPCTGTPTLRIDKLCFAHDQLRTNAPTTGSQSSARSTNCSTDVSSPAALTVSSVTDDGTMLGVPGSPISLDGLASTAAGGKSLWAFGDTFGCPGGNFSTSGGFGVPAAAAEGPNWVQRNCAELVPRTAAEIAFDAAHASCTPPPGGSCVLQRITMWSAGMAGLPDGSAVIPFSKNVNRNTLTDGDGNPTTPPTDTDWRDFTPLGVGLARVSAANVAARNPVADRSAAVAPLACNPASGGGATATGCLFDESVSPTSNSDRFWRPVVEGGFVYLFSDLSWQSEPFMFTGNTKLARAPLASIDTASAWRYWKGPGPNDWTTANTYAQAADVPGLRAGTVSYNPYLDKYINTWNDFGGAIDIQTASSLTGPWPAPQPLHDLIECAPNAASYAGGLHPELAMDGGRTLGLAYFRAGAAGCVGGARWATIRLG